MKKLLLASFIFIYSHGFAQSLTREKIIGEWICKKATPTDSIHIGKEEKTYLEVMRKAFVNSRFTFGDNNIFTIQFSKDTPKKIAEGLYMILNKKIGRAHV